MDNHPSLSDHKMMTKTNPSSIIISRTDNIGDVILTLPLVHSLKQSYPNKKLILLARNYVKPIVSATTDIDSFLDWDNLKQLPEEKIVSTIQNIHADTIIHAFPEPTITRLTKKAKIPTRISYFNKRLKYILRDCNKWVHFSTKRRSRYHESIRTLLLLKKLRIKPKLNVSELTPYVALNPASPLSEKTKQFLSPNRFNLIFHPGSNGHAQEWPVEHFIELYHLLPKDKFNIILTGTASEKEKFHDSLITKCPDAIDTMGKMSLDELISFIGHCDGLIAASTGPLHIAASVGIHCLGIFSPRRQINPRCWEPIGIKAEYLVSKYKCKPCLNKKLKECECTRLITPIMVKEKISHWLSI